jgi:hypothetical protein
VCETCYKACCETCYQTVTETCYRDCVKTVCRPVTTMKQVTRQVKHWETEQYTVPGRTHNRLVWQSGCCEFDPCTCCSHWKPGHLAWCCEKDCDQVKCRRVCKTECVCETVPCTTYVKECVHERVPYTVCKKVPYTVTKQVPYTVTRMVRETVTKEVPYTVRRIETQVVRRQVPYTVTRVVRGAYVDAPAAVTRAAYQAEAATPVAPRVGYPSDGPGRVFAEGATYEYTTTSTTTRMVPETRTRRVQYTVWQNETEDQVRRVPYTEVRMVPYTTTRVVPVTTCEMVSETHHKRVPVTTTRMESYTVCKQVPYTVCKQVPYTVTVKVPYTVTECVPTVVCKRVKVTTCEEVPVCKARRVPVCNAGYGNPCEDRGHANWLGGLFQRRMCCDPCEPSCGQPAGK